MSCFKFRLFVKFGAPSSLGARGKLHFPASLALERQFGFKDGGYRSKLSFKSQSMSSRSSIFINSDAILNRDALWFIQGKKQSDSLFFKSTDSLAFTLHSLTKRLSLHTNVNCDTIDVIM